MRLTCPNCDAEYDVPDGMMPAAGRHVQCTSCHTRWFARGTAEAAPSEEQILSRLESRSRHVPSASQPPAEGKPAPSDPETYPAAAPPPVVPLRPAKPSERPAVPRPSELAAVPPPRSAPRLDLNAAPVAPARPAPPASSGRFGLGLAVALLIFVLALGAYDFRQEVAAEVPSAAPTLDRYADAIDDLRDRLEQRIAPLRDRLDAALG
jgi:predicted Zn finger-like uncharacterized protein